MAEAPARVLLVEDTASLAAVYADYLRAAGHVVDHAPTASAVLPLARAKPPDAALLDLRLPDGDGLSVLRELRRASRRRSSRRSSWPMPPA